MYIFSASKNAALCATNRQAVNIGKQQFRVVLITFSIAVVVSHKAFSTQSTFVMTLGKKSFEKLREKKKILVTGIFSFSHNVFYSIKDRNHHLSYIYFVVCKCFQLGLIQNFVVRERIKAFSTQSTLVMTLGQKSFETLSEKKKILLPSIFSFSLNVFCPSQIIFELFESHSFCHL